MQVEIKIDDSCIEPKVIIITDKVNDEINDILNTLSSKTPEEQLTKHSFVRISNSEIINLKKVRNFDLSLSGTICVTLSDGTATYVSRRYVSKIKQVLGL